MGRGRRGSVSEEEVSELGGQGNWMGHLMSLLLLYLLDCFDNFSIVIHANNVDEVVR